MQLAGVDVARVRGLYPTLATRTAQLDGSFAALQPESVVRAIIATLRSAPAQPGSSSPRSRQSATRVLRARRAAADLVKGRHEDVVLGSSAASLLQRFTTLLSTDWQLGDEVVLNRLDADQVAHPMLRAARRRGVIPRWAEVDLDTGGVPAWQYDALIDSRTRVVTVALGNPLTGMVPDVAAIADRAHERGALVVVDAGVAPVHRPLDLEALGADVLVVSAPVFGGPTVGAAITRAGLLDELDEVAARGPTPLGFQALPVSVELLDGFTAAVDHLADLDEFARGSRRDRLEASLAAASGHTGALYARLDALLRDLPGVAVLGAPERALPVTAFTVDGHRPGDVGAYLQRHGVSVWTGPTGHGELLRAVGADEIGGVIALGLMPHTTTGELDQLVEALRSLLKA